MSRFHISMGSNMGNSLEIFRKAFIRISEIPGLFIVKASSIYNTKPWGKTDQPDFLNAVLLITFDGEGEALMRELLAVEQEFGRRRIIHWGPRTLDLDILYGENTTCHSELLTLPHPWFWDRLFVLVPMAEITPDFVYKGQRIQDRIHELGNSSAVRKEEFTWKNRSSEI